MQNLRYPTGGTPRFLKADTPADVQRSKEVRKDVIIEIVEEVADQIEQKKKIKAKAMPKPDPPDLPAKSDPAKLQAKTKPPPACATEPPPKAPPKGFESYASTVTTVKVKEEPKSSTETTVKKHKASTSHRYYGEKGEQQQDFTHTTWNFIDTCNLKCNSNSTCRSTS